MANDRTAIHLLAGGIAGTTGAVLTCPLEVVKTRLQSSVATFSTPSGSAAALAANKTASATFLQQSVANAAYATCTANNGASNSQATLQSASSLRVKQSIGLWHCLKHIVKHEGPRGLFKGLGPNLIGVAPSRAIYFWAYANSKKSLNTVLPPDTPIVHICAASCAGFTASTCTNPIWFVKTRIQLDQKRSTKGQLNAWRISKQIFKQDGIRGFYKGITASYYGISETVIHFVIYEGIKAKLRSMKENGDSPNRSAVDFLEFMGAGATSKTIASCIAYPHEVARTRLREQGSRYKKFWQTLFLVGKEEGLRGLYRGLCTQLVRQIPNTAIMMSTYEFVVYICTQHMFNDEFDDYDDED